MKGGRQSEQCWESGTEMHDSATREVLVQEAPAGVPVVAQSCVLFIYQSLPRPASLTATPVYELVIRN